MTKSYEKCERVQISWSGARNEGLHFVKIFTDDEMRWDENKSAEKWRIHLQNKRNEYNYRDHDRWLTEKFIKIISDEMMTGVMLLESNIIILI